MIDRQGGQHCIILPHGEQGQPRLMEGLNNKIRVLQRRVYGYRDEHYLKLKIVAAFPPPLTRNAEKDPL